MQQTRSWIVIMLTVSIVLSGIGLSMTWAARTMSLNNVIQRTTAVVAGTPFSVSLWWYRTGTCGNCGLWSVHTDGTTNHHFVMFEGGSGALSWQAQDTAANSAATTNTLGTNTWGHGCAVAASSTSRTHWLNADDANKGTNTSNRTPAGMNRTTFGRSPWGDTFSGRIAEIAVWSAALTLAECTALAAGASPYGIRRESLVSYVPVWGVHSPELDLAGPFDWPLVGTPPQSANHPPIAARGIER